MAEPTDNYYQIFQVKTDWKKLLASSKERLRQLEAFFDLGLLFSETPSSWNADDLDFVTATSDNDGKRYILITHASVVNMRNHLSAKLRMHEPLPFPPTHGHTYREIERIKFNNKRDYYKLSDSIKKTNKAVKSAERLADICRQYDQAKLTFREGRYVFLSLDVESWEHDHSKVIEIGWTLLDPHHSMGETKLLDQHYIIKEYHHLRNGTYVADYKDNFRFGNSIMASLEESVKELQKDIDFYSNRDGGICLVGHDLKIDIDYVDKLGIKWPHNHKIQHFDTAEINAARLGSAHDRIGLSKALDSVDIDGWCLHNAGNDAHYTMELFLKLCVMEPVVEGS